jgi:hypothetical protein
MELSLETRRQIVKYIGSRADVCSLCRVSKGFQYVAERALYNTLCMRQPNTTISLCDTLACQPRLSAHVEAFTIYLYGDQTHDQKDEDEDEDDSEEAPLPLPAEYWPSIARALRTIKHLRYLNIYISSHGNDSSAWILNDCIFQLRSFHCDLQWDQALVSFLNNQHRLTDLYIVDYNEFGTNTPTTSVSPSPSHRMDPSSLTSLSTLECTFAEAAGALVPGRPVTRLKTCFSASGISEKRAELSDLFSKISLSTRPFRALDIADSIYTEDFCMELLRAVAYTRVTAGELYYLGTLVLPIGGRQVRYFLHTPSMTRFC